jgi:hypothetical protein
MQYLLKLQRLEFLKLNLLNPKIQITYKAKSRWVKTFKNFANKC